MGRRDAGEKIHIVCFQFSLGFGEISTVTVGQTELGDGKLMLQKRWALRTVTLTHLEEPNQCHFQNL